MKAWLITWEWTSDSAAVADKIAGVLDPRRSSGFVLDWVEYFYAHATSTVDELRRYASHRKENPHRARYWHSGGITHSERIHCGHHPWLEARRVHDFRVVSDPETHVETISWLEPPLLEWSKDQRRVVQVSSGERMTITRCVQGPLRREVLAGMT